MPMRNLPGHDELENVQVGQGTPFRGPDSVPLRHLRDDKQYPQPTTVLHSLQRPIETLSNSVQIIRT